MTTKPIRNEDMGRPEIGKAATYVIGPDSKFDLVPIRGAIWQIDYTGEWPSWDNLDTVVSEALANGKQHLYNCVGYHGVVIIDGQRIEATCFGTPG